MKRFVTFVFALTFVLYLSNLSAAAQGKGNNRGPSVNSGPGNQGRAPEVQGRDRGKDIDHDRGHDAKAARDKEKEARRDETWQDRIESNPELRTRLTGMLPAGTNLQTASAGFKNQGQFIAALNVSKNLNIPFADLKSRMTGSNAMPLGKAIQELKPELPESQARKEAERAEKEAKRIEQVKRTS
jgi:hypothetical protein